MEPDCLEPLNLVMKKDGAGEPDAGSERDASSSSSPAVAEPEAETVRAASLEEPPRELAEEAPDQKLLSALYMSSLVQMSGVSPSSSPYSVGMPPNFVQLLAMVEARHRMWQQLSWPVHPGFLRGPAAAALAQPPYYDASHSAINEQLCNSPNSLINYPLPSPKLEQANHDAKHNVCNQRYEPLYFAPHFCFLLFFSISVRAVSPLLSVCFFFLLQVYDRAQELDVVACG